VKRGGGRGVESIDAGGPDEHQGDAGADNLLFIARIAFRSEWALTMMHESGTYLKKEFTVAGQKRAIEHAQTVADGRRAFMSQGTLSGRLGISEGA